MILLVSINASSKEEVFGLAIIEAITKNLVIDSYMCEVK